MSDLQDDDFTLPDGLDDAVSPALLPSTPASTRSSTPSDRQVCYILEGKSTGICGPSACCRLAAAMV